MGGGSSFLVELFVQCISLLPVGEPLNREAWQWYYRVVGEERCTVVDTYWQTGKNWPILTIMVKSRTIWLGGVLGCYGL